MNIKYFWVVIKITPFSYFHKRKEQFPNEESMERFLVTQFEDYNHRLATRCHIGFNKARSELTEMFEKLDAPKMIDLISFYLIELRLNYVLAYI